MNEKQESQALTLVPTESMAPALPGVASMLQTVIQGGVTEGNVGALEKLVDLYERMQAKDAEKAFAQAFNQLQAEMPKIVAEKAAPDKFGNTKFVFAPYEDIMAQVGPLLQKYGFTISFSGTYDQDRITKILHLQHVGGHTKSSQFTVRVGSGPPNASSVQADGAASTYAKRFALCDALNIRISKATGDADDPHTEGSPITKAQADSLRARVRATGTDEIKFLDFAEAKNYADIASSRYDELDKHLKRKESTK